MAPSYKLFMRGSCALCLHSDHVSKRQPLGHKSVFLSSVLQGKCGEGSNRRVGAQRLQPYPPACLQVAVVPFLVRWAGPDFYELLVRRPTLDFLGSLWTCCAHVKT
jgi:hypothetical protein